MCRSVHDEIDLKATPRLAYRTMMDSRAHARFTGAPARIDPVVGGKFSAGGYISGFNLDLVPGKRIVQAWRGSDWPKGAFSLVSFVFRPRGKGTRLIFDQRGIPDGIESGVTRAEWTRYYWDPLRRHFGARS
ncbi:MAG TPA: SRPBCC family protein [Thermoplasmata archaeon]|nr:SRPBCC family protein [Thermoplasmata archaeon]